MSLLLSKSSKSITVTNVKQLLVIRSNKEKIVKTLSRELLKIVEKPAIQVVEIARSGAQGPRGLPGGVIEGEVTINPSQTKIVDNGEPNILSSDWSVTVKDTVTSKVKSCKVRALITGSYVIYALVGDLIPFKVTVTTGMVLNLKNNHSNPILVKFNRISI